MYILSITAQHMYVVRAVSARTSIRLAELHEFDIGSSIVQNGAVADADAFAQRLKDVREKLGPKFKSCGLVIDSSLIYSKRLELPKLKPAEMSKIVRNEFIHIETEAEKLLIDYMSPRVQRPAQGQSIIVAYAMRKSLVEPYIKAFDRAGIRLEFIDTALNAFIKLMEKNQTDAKRSVIMTLLGDFSMTSVMFDHGAFELSNRMTLPAAQGTDEFSNALLQNLSSLLRFYQTLKKPEPLGAIYVGGLDASERQLCENLTRILEVDVVADIPIEGFSASPELSGANTDKIIYALGGAVER